MFLTSSHPPKELHFFKLKLEKQMMATANVLGLKCSKSWKVLFAFLFSVHLLHVVEICAYELIEHEAFELRFFVSISRPGRILVGLIGKFTHMWSVATVGLNGNLVLWWCALVVTLQMPPAAWHYIIRNIDSLFLQNPLVLELYVVVFWRSFVFVPCKNKMYIKSVYI